MEPNAPDARPPAEPPKPLTVVEVEPPASGARRRRAAHFPRAGEKPTRYTLPARLETTSPVGYRTRVALDAAQAEEALRLLSLERPTRFRPPSEPVTEQALFEEASLGVLSSRQSTNYRGFRQVTFGPEASARIGHLLRSLQHREAPVLDDAAYTHIVLGRPYRTPFTMLLTFAGHKPVTSLATVARRAWQKRFKHADDLPTIGALPHLHVGILADALERAAVLASGGARQAQVFMAPFCGRGRRDDKPVAHALEALCGLTREERARGWRVALVAQVGEVPEADRPQVSATTLRRLGANLLAFRSERILPGHNAEEKAPPQFHAPQPMDVPDALVVQCGRAAYNAFDHWTGCGRAQAKDLLLLDRVDALTPDGERRLGVMKKQQNDITDWVIRDLPLWADLPTGRAFSRNAERGRKAFALVGQRIYLGGLSRTGVDAAGLDWEHAMRATGAAAARSALYAELMGVVGLPDDCDLLAGMCLMAGPVNQNDIGKQFYGVPDLMAETYPDKAPFSLLVWTLKAKTVADPIGNEEQLMNAARQGALVDLRCGPHEACRVEQGGRLLPLRDRDGRRNAERAFADVDNFVRAPDGGEIPGNRGSAWPRAWADAPLWPANVERSTHEVRR
ncbi:MAG: hypothetical protein ACOYM9_14775 [Bradymonadia bacterium]